MFVSEYIVPIPKDSYGREYIKIVARNWDSNRVVSWAVIDKAGLVLCKSGDWVYEPSPSNRDDDFLQDTRFETAGEAHQALLEQDRKTGEFGFMGAE